MKRLPVLKDSVITIPNGPNKGKKFIVNSDSFYASGQYEADSVMKMLDIIKDDDIVYDIGANMGYYSMAFSDCCKQVYAFEPLPKNLEIVEQHIAENNINNVDIFPYAITDEDKTLIFTSSQGTASNTYKTDSETFQSASNTIEVEGKSLDNLVLNGEIPPPNFIKIDVEGAELDLLHGAEKVLLKYKPAVVVATHDMVIPGIKDKCLAFLDKVNYKYSKTSDLKDNVGLEDYFAFPKS